MRPRVASASLFCHGTSLAHRSFISMFSDTISHITAHQVYPGNDFMSYLTPLMLREALFKLPPWF